MDYRGAKLLGFLGLGLTLASLAAAEKGTFPLRAMDWLVPDGRYEALSSEPLVRWNIKNASKQTIDRLIIGQTLFHTPTILGGQAAKAGISCASCHSNGRSNPHFLFPGVSGEAGTADVTHSFFSSFRGNAAFDPVIIPDLTKPGKISREPANGELEKFVRDLIVEEFDGAEPGTATLDALAHYIRSIVPPRDEGDQLTRVKRDMETDLDRAEEAFYAAGQTLQKGDTRLALLLFAGARHQTGLIYERFQGADLNQEAERLEQLGQQLGAIQNAARNNSPRLNQLMQEWNDDFSRARDIIEEAADRSLYNPERLKAALQK